MTLSTHTSVKINSFLHELIPRKCMINAAISHAVPAILLYMLDILPQWMIHDHAKWKDISQVLYAEHTTYDIVEFIMEMTLQTFNVCMCSLCLQLMFHTWFLIIHSQTSLYFMHLFYHWQCLLSVTNTIHWKVEHNIFSGRLVISKSYTLFSLHVFTSWE